MELPRLERAALAVLPLTLALAAPAAAQARGSWSLPARIAGAPDAFPQVAFTPSGRGVIAWNTFGLRTPSPGTQGAAIGIDGRVAPALARSSRLGLARRALAAYGRDRVVIGGTVLRDRRSRPAVAYGTTAGRIGPPRLLAVPGVSGDLRALAVSRSGDLAVVASMCVRRSCAVRELWLVTRPAGGPFAAPVRLARGERVRGAAVATNARGDALAAWEDDRVIRTRMRTAAGRAGRIERLGRGVQSSFSVALGPTRRAVVAWGSQRVSEGDALGPFEAFATYRAVGARFGSAQLVGRSTLTGTGRYVAEAGVRAAVAARRATVTYTAFDGERFVVRSRDLAGRRFGAAQTLSPLDRDAILADAATGSRGEQLVTWITGRHGADPIVGTSHGLMAAARAPAAPRFAAGETITAGRYIDAASVAIDPISGRAVAAWRDVVEPVAYAVRAP
ncbi:MAG: hypothetical protein H0T43_06605 [Solirubrobacterales bacterium]|nr:hypothetical protein [Solirubrobacterales bacterium]